MTSPVILRPGIAVEDRKHRSRARGANLLSSIAFVRENDDLQAFDTPNILTARQTREIISFTGRHSHRRLRIEI